MNKVLMVGAAMVVAAGTAFAGAHGSMSDQRVKAMKGVGGAMKAIGDGKGDPVENAKKANMLMSGMLEMFPEGSAEYRAKANIWTDWAGFEKAMNNSVAASENLVKAAMTGDQGATFAALGAMGKTCKACHTDYRGPKPK
jgi:cytochrome c556